MGSYSREIIKAIEDSRDAETARRIALACAGHAVHFGSDALARGTHPFCQVLGIEAAGVLVAELRARGVVLRPTRFHSSFDTDYDRALRERSELIRRMLLDGAGTAAIVREANVSSRTVGKYRAQLRAEGLIPNRSAGHER